MKLRDTYILISALDRLSGYYKLMHKVTTNFFVHTKAPAVVNLISHINQLKEFVMMECRMYQFFSRS